MSHHPETLGDDELAKQKSTDDLNVDVNSSECKRCKHATMTLSFLAPGNLFAPASTEEFVDPSMELHLWNGQNARAATCDDGADRELHARAKGHLDDCRQAKGVQTSPPIVQRTSI
jgi:hypothetical protein